MQSANKMGLINKEQVLFKKINMNLYQGFFWLAGNQYIHNKAFYSPCNSRTAVVIFCMIYYPFEGSIC